MSEKQPRLYFSFGRLWTISQNTMTEIIRQKFFYILVFFGIALMVSSIYFSQFSSAESAQAKFIKDFGLAAIKIFGTLIAMVGTAQLLPMELDNRTIYPILAKPVHRGEFLMGKWFGMVTLLLITTLLMSVIFSAVLFYTENQLKAAVEGGTSLKPGVQMSEADSYKEIEKQTRDPALVKAVALIYFQMVMMSAMTLLVATFSTSVIFTVIASVMVYMCGHLVSTARAEWTDSNSVPAKIMLLLVSFFIPDLGKFDVVDFVVIGQVVPWKYVLNTIGYGVVYSGVTLLVSYFIFQEKEI